jgi:hypothetical protein
MIRNEGELVIVSLVVCAERFEVRPGRVFAFTDRNLLFGGVAAGGEG